MGCAQVFAVQGGMRPKASLLGRGKALLGNALASPSNWRVCVCVCARACARL